MTREWIPEYHAPAVLSDEQRTKNEEAQAKKEAKAEQWRQWTAVHIGLDVGQKQDPSAVCITGVSQRPTGKTYHIRQETRQIYETTYRVQHLERIDLGTAFVKVVDRVAQLVGELWVWEKDLRKAGELEPEEPQLPWELWIDATGLGAPVYETLRQTLQDDPKTDRVRVHPVRFTFGDRFVRGAYDGESDSLGKAYLVARLQVLMQKNALFIPKGSKEIHAMLAELKSYEIRVTEHANETYGAFVTGAHDDLVTAMGLSIIEDPGEYRGEEGVNLWE